MPLRGLGFGCFDAIGQIGCNHLLTDSDIQSSAQPIVVLAYSIGRQRGFGQQIGIIALNFLWCEGLELDFAQTWYQIIFDHVAVSVDRSLGAIGTHDIFQPVAQPVSDCGLPGLYDFAAVLFHLMRTQCFACFGDRGKGLCFLDLLAVRTKAEVQIDIEFLADIVIGDVSLHALSRHLYLTILCIFGTFIVS